MTAESTSDICVQQEVPLDQLQNNLITNFHWMLLIDFLVNRKNYDDQMKGRGRMVKNPNEDRVQEKELEYSTYNDIIYDWTLQLCDELDKPPTTIPKINLFTVVVSSDLQRICLKDNLTENDTLKEYLGGIKEDDIKGIFYNKTSGQIEDHIYSFATILLFFGLAAPHNDKNFRSRKKEFKEFIGNERSKIPDMSHLLQEVIRDIQNKGERRKWKDIRNELESRRPECCYRLSGRTLPFLTKEEIEKDAQNFRIGSYWIVGAVKLFDNDGYRLKEFQIDSDNQNNDMTMHKYNGRTISNCDFFSHSNLVKATSLCIENDKIIGILFEDAGISLTNYVHANSPLGEEALLSITIQLLDVINYFHLQGVVYRDINPENVLLKQESCSDMGDIPFNNWKLKLANLGDARRTHKGVRRNTSHVVSDQYRAPEVCSWENTNRGSKNELQEYSLKADCYSVAMTLYYAMTTEDPGEPKVDGQDAEAQNESIRQLGDLSNYYSSIVEIIKMCDYINPKYRKTIEEVFSVAKKKVK